MALSFAAAHLLCPVEQLIALRTMEHQVCLYYFTASPRIRGNQENGLTMPALPLGSNQMGRTNQRLVTLGASNRQGIARYFVGYYFSLAGWSWPRNRKQFSAGRTFTRSSFSAIGYFEQLQARLALKFNWHNRNRPMALQECVCHRSDAQPAHFKQTRSLARVQLTVVTRLLGLRNIGNNRT